MRGGGVKGKGGGIMDGGGCCVMKRTRGTLATFIADYYLFIE